MSVAAISTILLFGSDSSRVRYRSFGLNSLHDPEPFYDPEAVPFAF